MNLIVTPIAFIKPDFLSVLQKKKLYWFCTNWHKTSMENVATLRVRLYHYGGLDFGYSVNCQADSCATRLGHALKWVQHAR